MSFTVQFKETNRRHAAKEEQAQGQRQATKEEDTPSLEQDGCR